MGTKKKVLIVEDHGTIRFLMKELLKDSYTVLEATTCTEARYALENNAGIMLIAMDGTLDVGATSETTFSLIQEIKRDYPYIKMIAMSSNKNDLRRQCEAGCQYSVTHKDEVVGKIRQILPAM